MNKTLRIVCIAAFSTMFSNASIAQEIPLNIFVTGSTGAESTQSQVSGSLTSTASTTASLASAASKLVISTASSTSTN